jgi:uncharacterized membrane protein
MGSFMVSTLYHTIASKPGTSNRKVTLALAIATVVIFLQPSFRVAEISGGFHGMLWNSEMHFMVLDGTIVALSSIFLTVFYPRRAFHGRWD